MLNGGSTTYSLSGVPGSTNNLSVSVEGIELFPGIDFSVSGNSVTFVSAPVSGMNNVMVSWLVGGGGGGVGGGGAVSAEKQVQTFNGGGSVFILSGAPGSSNNLEVVVNGFALTPGIDFAVSGTTLTLTTTSPAGTANVVAKWGLGISVATSYKEVQTFNGGDTVYSLSSDPGSVKNLEVSVNGSLLKPTLDYTVVGTTLTLNSPAAAGTNNVMARWGLFFSALPAYQDWQVITFNGTGSQTAFTLPSSPTSLGNIDVTVDGITLTAVEEFTLSGTTLTFVSAPPAGTKNIAIRYGQSLPIGTIGANGVTVVDEGSYFTGTNQENINQEIGESVKRSESSQFGSRWRQRGTLYPKVVITGDSLSFNREDFDSTGRANAYDCFPGLNSWAFLLRDALIRDDPWFQHADEVLFQLSDNVSELGNGATAQFVAPFNGRLIQFRSTNQAGTVDIYYKHMGPQTKCYLWFLKNPLNTGCSIDIKDSAGVVQVDNFNLGGTVAGTDPYQGLELVAIEVPCNNNGLIQKLTLTDFIGTHASPHATNRDLFFMGVSSRYVQVNLTGRGGQSSKFLVDNLSSKITSFAPDLLVMIIGTNDPWSGNPQGLQTTTQYYENLRVITDGVTAVNPTAEILLISPALTNESIVSNAVMQTYIDTARRFAKARGIGFLGLDKLFEKTPSTVYRFDQVHFSKAGNEQLVRRVFDMILGTQEGGPGYLSPHNSLGGNNVRVKMPEINPVRMYFTWSGTDFTATQIGGDKQLGSLVSLVKVNEGVVQLNLALASVITGNITLRQLGVNGSVLKLECNGYAYFNNRVLFSLRKVDGSLTIAGDWTGNQSSFQFIVEIS